MTFEILEMMKSAARRAAFERARRINFLSSISQAVSFTNCLARAGRYSRPQHESYQVAVLYFEMRPPPSPISATPPPPPDVLYRHFRLEDDNISLITRAASGRRHAQLRLILLARCRPQHALEGKRYRAGQIAGPSCHDTLISKIRLQKSSQLPS